MVGIKLIFVTVAMTLAHFVPLVGVLPLAVWCLGFPALALGINRNALIYGIIRFVNLGALPYVKN